MKPRVHLLYEHGDDKKPFGSAYIRLLRPFSHPVLQNQFEVTSGLTYDNQSVEAVIVDRLWRPDISVELATDLIERVHQHGSRLIYSLDDNFLDLPTEGKDWVLTPERRQLVELFLARANQVIVTTPNLKTRFLSYNPNIIVIPNILDERLLSLTNLWRENSSVVTLKTMLRYSLAKLKKRLRPTRPLVIGYMGTWTHDDDLRMILPALQAINQRYQGQITFEFVGVMARPETVQALEGLPIKLIVPPSDAITYPQFMPWFTSMLAWDIVIAPLQDTPFNQCKSHIKFLDYSALGVAGIYSRVPAYESTVCHGETGWLTENRTEAWERALDELVTNISLRENLTRKATQSLYQNWILTNNGEYWRKALNVSGEDFSIK